MKPLLAALSLAAFAGLATSGPADAFGGVKPRAPERPPESYTSQWYTTSDGCSYSRASAPGYGVMWVLILNPHHIGQPTAGPHCKATL